MLPWRMTALLPQATGVASLRVTMSPRLISLAVGMILLHTNQSRDGENTACVSKLARESQCFRHVGVRCANIFSLIMLPKMPIVPCPPFAAQQYCGQVRGIYYTFLAFNV